MDNEKLVYSRYIYGFIGNQPTVTFSRDSGWTDEFAKTYGPFAYGTPKIEDGYKRKWRLNCIYWDENSGGQVHVEVKCNLLDSGKSVLFSLPRIAGGWGWNAQNYSDWYQFGDGSQKDIDTSHATWCARLNSTAPYDNHGQIMGIILEAYDFTE